MTQPAESDAPRNLRADQVEVWREAYRAGVAAGVACERGRHAVHPDVDYCEHDVPDYLTCGYCAARVIPPALTAQPTEEPK